MNVEAELRKIKFANLSRVKEELLRKILKERRIRRESDTELGVEELDSVSAAKKMEIMEAKQT
jgi:hypothetical protein